MEEPAPDQDAPAQPAPDKPRRFQFTLAAAVAVSVGIGIVLYLHLVSEFRAALIVTTDFLILTQISFLVDARCRKSCWWVLLRFSLAAAVCVLFVAEVYRYNGLKGLFAIGGFAINCALSAWIAAQFKSKVLQILIGVLLALIGTVALVFITFWLFPIKISFNRV
jgi:hypothetical protein